MTEFEYDLDAFIKKAEDNGFDITSKQVYWSVGGSQGDGASFECKRVNVPKFIAVNCPGQYPRLEEAFKNGDFDITIDKMSHHYAHEYTMGVSPIDHTTEIVDKLADALGTIAEGGKEFEDSLAEFGDVVLARARSLATELHADIEHAYSQFLDDEPQGHNDN